MITSSSFVGCSAGLGWPPLRICPNMWWRAETNRASSPSRTSGAPNFHADLTRALPEVQNLPETEISLPRKLIFHALRGTS
jgi:hypothetical protein